MHWSIQNKMALVFSAVVIILIIISLTSYRNAFRLSDANQDVIHSHEVRKELETLLSVMKDAETGQRGYIITGNGKYLEPYLAAQASATVTLTRLDGLLKDNSAHLRNLNQLKPIIRAKFDELNKTIELRRNAGYAAAQRVVLLGNGKESMDGIRRVTGFIGDAESELLTKRIARANQENSVTMITIIIATLLYLLLLALGFYAVNRYISERKEIEAKINLLNENLERRASQLEQANSAMETFCYAVSHDLRAPLRHVNAYSQTLLNEYSNIVDEQGREYLSRLCSASKRMGILIDDLLDLYRVSRLEIRREQVDLTALIRAIARNLQVREPARNVRLLIEEDVTAWGDSRLLRQALHNLLENAWKYTANRPAATISFGCKELRGAKTYFISDNGIGFDIAYAGKLFKAFERLHGVDEFEGTGIGLASVRRIVERHGGQVWGEGKLDEGATFYFTLG